MVSSKPDIRMRGVIVMDESEVPKIFDMPEDEDRDGDTKVCKLESESEPDSAEKVTGGDSESESIP